MKAGRTRTVAAVVGPSLAAAVGALAIYEITTVERSEVPGETEAERWTAHDQWIALRGGAPATRTPMAPPRRPVDVRQRLVPRHPAGGLRRIHRERPTGFEPVVIVVHATGSGRPGSGFGSLDELHAFFTRPTARASAHYAIDRSGRIMRLVAESDAAFHVATPGWNDISIGIELLNDNSGRQSYPPAQLAALTELARTLGERYAIPVEGVVRHATIQPEDRRDPVGFPWRRWLRSLHDAQPLASGPR